MTHPTQSDLERAICCPDGCLGGEQHCQAYTHNKEARAVAALYVRAWREYAGNTGPMVARRTLEGRED